MRHDANDVYYRLLGNSDILFQVFKAIPEVQGIFPRGLHELTVSLATQQLHEPPTGKHRATRPRAQQVEMLERTPCQVGYVKTACFLIEFFPQEEAATRYHVAPHLVGVGGNAGDFLHLKIVFRELVSQFPEKR